MTPKDWRKYERHEISARYPDLKGQAWEDFRDGVTQRTARLRPIITFEGRILDGWQLYRACLEKGIEPVFAELRSGEDPEEFVDQANNRRRHETQEMLAARRDLRDARIIEARLNGKSMRTIAEQENVDAATVHRVLTEATVAGATVDPPNGVINRADGKLQAVSPPKTDSKKILCLGCRTCERKGQPLPEKCKECAELNKPKPAPSRRKPQPKPASRPGFDWPYFLACYGGLSHCIDRVADDGTAIKLKSFLESFKADFTTWAEKTLNEKSPEITRFPAGLLADSRFSGAWSDWEQHRREIKKPLTELASKQMLKQLGEWGPERSIAAIELSIRSGWQGIFEGNGTSKAGKKLGIGDAGQIWLDMHEKKGTVR